MKKNKLLTPYDFIPFGEFSLENLDEALTISLTNAEYVLTNSLNQTTSTWELVIEPLHGALYSFHNLWSIVNHLVSVNDNKEIRALENKFQKNVTEFYVNLGQNKKLYEHYTNIKQTQYNSLTDVQKRVIDNEFRDFFLSGIGLDDKAQNTFKSIQIELEELATKFSQNILDATDSFTKYVTCDELSGIPNDILQMYQELANKDNKPNLYKITLHAPCYLPIMQYCENRTLREQIYKEYVTRASEFGNLAFDNTKLIGEIINLRMNKARTLGFKNYSELSLYTKMADNSKQVLDFLYELANKSKDYAISDIKELQEFAFNSAGLKKLEAWDIPFFSEKLQQAKYSYSNNDLKQYFQLPNVLTGLFQLIKTLFNIEFKPRHDIPTWHKDTLTFDVFNNNTVIGNLYLDLYSRNGKQQGAWMNSAQDKYIYQNKLFNPMAYVICNFPTPVNDTPSLLNFDEVQTLFHEIGHAMHQLTTKISHFAISGINGVEWDAVELPSQFMEYFAWHYGTLSTLSKHITSNEVLPLELYNKLLASRYFQSGLQMLRQIEFSVFDMLLHCEENPNTVNYLELLDTIRKNIAVITPPKYNRFPNSFSHIFAGGYASGYYSYKWAEVLATDIFNVFDTNGPTKYFELGQKFYENILSQGAIKPMMENFKAFMGRTPQIDALLKYTFGK